MKFRYKGRTYKRALDAGMLQDFLLSFKPLKKGAYLDPKTLEIKEIQYKLLFNTVFIYREHLR